MSKKYCTSCGTEMGDDAAFCVNCGAKVEIREKRVESPESGDRLHDYSITNNSSIAEPTKFKAKSVNIWKPIVVLIIIATVVAVPLITLSSISSLRNELDTFEYNIPFTGLTNVELNIDNDIGSIEIIYDSTLTDLFDAEIEVLGGLRASIDDAVNFSHEIIGDVVVITFEFSNPIQNYFSMKTLIHNISIRFNPIAKVDYNVVTDTGSIDCDLDGKDNLVIPEIYLATSTGSIDFISRSATNITIGDVSLQSSTGGVHFNFDNAQNTSLTNLNLFTSTGSILANLGKEMSLNCTDVDIETSTGSIDLIYEDIILNNDLDWAITTSTGSIDIIIVQTLISAVNVSSTFDVQTSTGSISVECDLVSDIGVEIDASTSTGSIVLPGPGSYYISPDFALKSIQYSFVLSTSTGSIEASIDF